MTELSTRLRIFAIEKAMRVFRAWCGKAERWMPGREGGVGPPHNVAR
jgi:hypothetical protein